MFYQNATQVKAYARTLKESLTATGFEVSFGKALDIVSKTHGYPDWNAYSAALSEKAVNAMLAEHELGHAYDAGDADLRALETGGNGYGPESILQVHTGFTLRVPAHPEECGYVRVCDPLGRETSFWNSQEWQDSPEEVMGAIFGALVRGQSLSNKGLLPKRQRANSTPALPTIQDVDFNKVHAVIFGGRCYSIGWREDAVLAKVGTQPQKSAADDSWDAQALLLTYMEDGLVCEEKLYLSKLLELKWDTKYRAFADSTGGTYIFVIEEFFADYFDRTGPRKATVQPGTEGVKVVVRESGSAARPSEDEFKLFTFWSEADQKTHLFVGTSAQDAAFRSWADPLPVVDAAKLKQMDSELYGPFIVEVDIGFYNEFDTLSKAVKVAQGLLKADDNIDQTSVLSKNGTRLISFTSFPS